MSDLKISGATANASPAATDEFPTNKAGASKRTTLAQVKTFANTAPVYAAGSATASTWPLFSSGTLLTTPEAGAIEFDGNAFYLTSDAGNRGVVPTLNLIRQDAAYTLTSTTSKQKLFNASTNGRLTLEVGTYVFECLAIITALSATSGNGAFDILGAGGATLGSVAQISIGLDGALNTAAALSGLLNTVSQSAAAQQVAGTSTVWGFLNRGTFEVTVAGTIVPSVTLLTAAAGSVNIGSYFFCYRIGGTALTIVGQWD